MSLPERIGPYRVVRLLGQGGMGAVFCVEDPSSPRHLALKLILEDKADDVGLDRFWREAEILGRTHHRNIVKVHKIGQAQQGTFLLMELIEGTSLREVCRGGGREPKEAAGIVRDLADAVQNLHVQRVLHRDIKPENVILRPDGIPVLLDFGLVRDENAESLTRTGTSLGTLAYMSPEQLTGVSPSLLEATTDVYSLGVVLFELLTGKRPFTGSPAVIVGQVMGKPAPLASSKNARVPPALDAVCRWALEKEPEDRYPTAAALRDDLARFLEGSPSEAELRFAAPRRRWPWVVVAVVLLATAVSVGGVMATRDDGPKVGIQERQRRTRAIGHEAWELLSASRPFAADEAEIAGLRARLASLQARNPVEAPLLNETRQRVLALAALTELAAGDPASAKGLVAELAATDSPALSAVRGALAAEQDGDGVKDLTRAIERGFGRPELRLWRARCLLRAGEREEALRDAERGLKVKSLPPRWRLRAAHVQLSAGDGAQAKATLDATLDALRGDPDAGDDADALSAVVDLLPSEAARAREQLEALAWKQER